MDIIEHHHKNTTVRHPWELARLEVIYALIRKHLTADIMSNILDVGCGDTFVVSELKRKMPKSSFFAIDTAFSDEMIHHFQHDGIKLYKNIDELDKKIEKADLILLMDVIEHIEDDKTFLKKLLLKDYIKEQSLFLITVPAYQSLFSKHDIFLKHFRRYAPKQLVNTLKNSGYQIIESGNFFSSLIIPRLISLAKEKLLGKSKAQGLASWNGSKKQSTLLKDILFLDYKTTNIIQQLGVKLPGLSTYVICRKSV